MLLLLIVLLVIAAATGALWTILEIAAAVALGIFLAAVLISVAAYLLIRSRLRRYQREYRGRYPERPYD